MPYHALLIGSSDCSRLQLLHRRECLFDPRLHSLEKVVWKFHSADVDGKIEMAVVQKILLKTLPERRGRHRLS